MPWPEHVELSAHLRSLEKAQMKPRVPPPIIVRVDQLVRLLMERVRALGDVSRDELIAALIHTTEPQTDDLLRRVLAYREADVHHTLLDTKKTRGIYTMPPREQGRPSH
jgi:hypothetical protein